MSAFIVNKSSIDAIVTFAVGGKRRVTTCRSITNPETFSTTNDHSPAQLGQALWHENYLSVNYRYRADDETPVYKYKPQYDGHVGTGQKRLLTPIDIIKLCDCLEYQSCEHPGWETSWAKDLLDRVRRAATRELPGYEDAPWGLYDRGVA